MGFEVIMIISVGVSCLIIGYVFGYSSGMERGWSEGYRRGIGMKGDVNHGI